MQAYSGNLKDSKKRTPLFAFLRNYLLYNIFIFCLLGFTYVLQTSIPDNIFDILFVFTTIVGHFGLIALIFIGLPISFLILCFPCKWFVLISSVLLSGLILAILVADALIFSTYFYHINTGLLEIFLSENGYRILNLSIIEYYTIAATLMIVFIFEYILAIYSWHIQRVKLNQCIFYLFLTLICTLISHTQFAFASASGRYSVIQYNHFFPLYYGLEGHKVDKAFSKIGLLSTPLFKEKKTKTFLNYPKEEIKSDLSHTSSNILIIVIDAWRFDCLKAEITPNIAQLSETALNYTNYFSGGNCTKGGIFSLFYGLPAIYWYTMDKGPVLIDELNKRDYEMCILASAGLEYPKFTQNVFKKVRGLQASIPGDSPWKCDEYITKASIHFIEKAAKTKRPFFLFAFFDSAHGYDVPPSYPLQFQPQKKDINRITLTKTADPILHFNRYKNALHYVDSQIGLILKKIRELKLDQNTIIILTADHGEEFNDNGEGYWGHSSNFTHFQIKVPLVIQWPTKNSGEIDYKTSSYDIVPTLMEEAFSTINPPYHYSIGKNLFNITGDSWKYLICSSVEYDGIVADDMTIHYHSSGYTQFYDAKGIKMKNGFLDQEKMNWYGEINRRFLPN